MFLFAHIFIAGPSEKYWQVISERRKKALLEALEEHQQLQAAAIALEEENLSLAVLLDNTNHLVNTLKVKIFSWYFKSSVLSGKLFVSLLMIYRNYNIIIKYCKKTSTR